MFGLAPLPRSLAAALRDLGSPKLEVRRAVVRDLVRHARAGEAEARAALGAALSDSAEEVRADAALALADSDVRDHLAALTRLAHEDASTRVRQLALLALGELAESHDTPAIDVLSAAHADANPAERFQALLALHQIGAPGAEAAIIQSLVDPDSEIRKLGFRIAEAHWADAAELPELVRARARDALRASSPRVRTAAALLLGRYGDTSAEDILILLVRRKMPEATVEDEQAALELAAALRLETARPWLERRAFGWWRDPLAYDARIALARLGDERARISILRDLDAWSFRARTLAVAAVGRARIVEAKSRLQKLLERPEVADAAAVREALAQLEMDSPA